jgi:hypothetical protein
LLVCLPSHTHGCAIYTATAVPRMGLSCTWLITANVAEGVVIFLQVEIVHIALEYVYFLGEYFLFFKKARTPLFVYVLGGCDLGQL